MDDYNLLDVLLDLFLKKICVINSSLDLSIGPLTIQVFLPKVRQTQLSGL